MKQRTAAHRRLLCVAFAAMAALLALLLWQGIRRGDAVRVGIPHSASAYGAAMLLQSPTAQYACTVGSTVQVLEQALQSGDLDAALIPAIRALEIENTEIHAVLGYMPLVVASEEEIDSVHDLEGKSVTIDEALADTSAENMLRTLLRKAKVECEVSSGTAGEIFVCALDDAAHRSAPIRLSLSEAWKDETKSAPPAGLCLVVRKEYLDRAGTDFAAFERSLESAMSYGADKRKKTVAMAAAAGLAVDEGTADRLYPFCDFLYLTGDAMDAALRSAEACR